MPKLFCARYSMPSPGEIDLEGREAWLRRIRDWNEKHPLTYCQGSEKILTTYAIDTLYKLTKGDAIIVSDVGQHQMWVAQFYKFERPRTHLTSGGLGTMGFSFPAAMGAKYARPDEQVICVAGDGSSR